MDGNTSKRRLAACNDKSPNMPTENGREKKKARKESRTKAPVGFVDLTNEDDYAPTGADSPPAKIKVDYGDRVVELTAERRPKTMTQVQGASRLSEQQARCIDTSRYPPSLLTVPRHLAHLFEGVTTILDFVASSPLYSAGPMAWTQVVGLFKERMDIAKHRGFHPFFVSTLMDRWSDARSAEFKPLPAPSSIKEFMQWAWIPTIESILLNSMSRRGSVISVLGECWLVTRALGFESLVVSFEERLIAAEELRTEEIKNQYYEVLQERGLLIAQSQEHERMQQELEKMGMPRLKKDARAAQLEIDLASIKMEVNAITERLVKHLMSTKFCFDLPKSEKKNTSHLIDLLGPPVTTPRQHRKTVRRVVWLQEQFSAAQSERRKLEHRLENTLIMIGKKSDNGWTSETKRQGAQLKLRLQDAITKEHDLSTQLSAHNVVIGIAEDRRLEALPQEDSPQPVPLKKQSLKERLLAAQREERLLDDQLKAQSSHHTQPITAQMPSHQKLHEISSDEDEKCFPKLPRQQPSRHLDRTKNCSAIDLPPDREPAPRVDINSLAYAPSTQSAVRQERSEPYKPKAPKAKKAKVEPELCDEQRALVNLIASGKNVFYTGSAGCGKSTVLKAFVKELKARGRNVVIVAPTGKAALEVNGCTFWTFAGWTPGHFKKPLETLRKGAHGKFVRKKLKEVDVLVIDEVSMMENHAFERLNEVMQAARGRKEAFGGVQLVVTGDFCQLPPVKPFQNCITCGREMTQKQRETLYNCKQHGDFLDIDKWAFRSSGWRQASFQHVNLTTIHRQRDRKFIDILEKCRMGKKLTQKETDLLLNHKTNVTNAVRLFPTRNEVRTINSTEFNKIPHEKRTFKCFDHFSHRENHPHLQWKNTRDHDGSLQALREHKFESQIELKEGMLVVLQVNLSIDEGLVNGSQGIIVGWEPYDPAKMPKHVDRDAKPSAPQPMNPIFGDHAILREENIKLFMEQAPVKEWPIVNFDNGVQRTIFADCVLNELGDEPPYSILSRTQIPLVAGWAMTVHKSQGMTLNKVIVDLSKSFEEGQMYVALSRATTLNGLKVEGLGEWRGGGNEQVREFLFEKFGIGKD